MPKSSTKKKGKVQVVTGPVVNSPSRELATGEQIDKIHSLHVKNLALLAQSNRQLYTLLAGTVNYLLSKGIVKIATDINPGHIVELMQDISFINYLRQNIYQNLSATTMLHIASLFILPLTYFPVAGFQITINERFLSNKIDWKEDELTQEEAEKVIQRLILRGEKLDAENNKSFIQLATTSTMPLFVTLFTSAISLFLNADPQETFYYFLACSLLVFFETINPMLANNVQTHFNDHELRTQLFNRKQLIRRIIGSYGVNESNETSILELKRNTLQDSELIIEVTPYKQLTLNQTIVLLKKSLRQMNFHVKETDDGRIVISGDTFYDNETIDDIADCREIIHQNFNGYITSQKLLKQLNVFAKEFSVTFESLNKSETARDVKVSMEIPASWQALQFIKVVKGTFPASQVYIRENKIIFLSNQALENIDIKKQIKTLTLKILPEIKEDVVNVEASTSTSGAPEIPEPIKVKIKTHGIPRPNVNNANVAPETVEHPRVPDGDYAGKKLFTIEGKDNVGRNRFGVWAVKSEELERYPHYVKDKFKGMLKDGREAGARFSNQGVIVPQNGHVAKLKAQGIFRNMSVEAHDTFTLASGETVFVFDTFIRSHNEQRRNRKN